MSEDGTGVDYENDALPNELGKQTDLVSTEKTWS
jgi:hypothetical protein